MEFALGSGAIRYKYHNFVFAFFGEIGHDSDMLNINCCPFEHVDEKVFEVFPGTFSLIRERCFIFLIMCLIQVNVTVGKPSFSVFKFPN